MNFYYLHYLYLLRMIIFVSPILSENNTDNATCPECLSTCSNMTNFSRLYIENGTLNNFPFTSYTPQYHCACDLGSTYLWKPISENMPYTAFKLDRLAYSAKSTNTCDLCVISEDGSTYTPKENNNYHIDFVPFCAEQSCHMFGVVYHQPYFPESTFINAYKSSYEGPLPYLEPITSMSKYLKVSSIGCNGCESLMRQKKCYDVMNRMKNDTYVEKLFDGQMPLMLTQVIIIVVVFGTVGTVSSFIYLFVLYILITTKDLWTFPVYKLMFNLGIFALIDIWLQIYYASSWGIWYGAYSRRFLIAALNLISFGISSFTFALALNRWDVIAKPDQLNFLNGNFVSIVIIILTYIGAAGIFVWQSLPGWGRFMIYLETNYGPYYMQVREYQNLVEYFIQLDIEQGLMVASIILYGWCIAAIIYKRFVTQTKLANKEKFLFVQTLTPCLVRVIANLISMFIQSSEPWFLILTSALFFFEACHYPFLYLIFNQTIRYYLARIFFRVNGTPSVMKGAATKVWPSQNSHNNHAWATRN